MDLYSLLGWLHTVISHPHTLRFIKVLYSSHMVPHRYTSSFSLPLIFFHYNIHTVMPVDASLFFLCGEFVSGHIRSRSVHLVDKISRGITSSHGNHFGVPGNN